MTLRQFPLARLSICPCGYGFLDDSIQLGVKYTLDLDTFKTLTAGCGRCRRRQRVVAVKASQQLHPERPMEYLPASLFDIPKDILCSSATTA